GRRAIFDAGHIWALERGADGAGDCFLLRGVAPAADGSGAEFAAEVLSVPRQSHRQRISGQERRTSDALRSRLPLVQRRLGPSRRGARSGLHRHCDLRGRGAANAAGPRLREER
ncbi:unnamed protein product, partial [Effrenium voratum]